MNRGMIREAASREKLLRVECGLAEEVGDISLVGGGGLEVVVVLIPTEIGGGQGKRKCKDRCEYCRIFLHGIAVWGRHARTRACTEENTMILVRRLPEKMVFFHSNRRFRRREKITSNPFSVV